MRRVGNVSSALALAACCLVCQSVPGASASKFAIKQRQPEITPAPTAVAAAAATESFTAVSDCHQHGTDVYCVFGPSEYEVILPATATGELPATFTDCHKHGQDAFCVAPDGSDVEIVGFEESTEGESAEGEGTSSAGTSEPDEQHCHFHAGVEHCVGGGESEESSGSQCSRQDRDYKIGLRVGMLFVMLVAGLVGACGPIFLHSVLPSKFHVIFNILKQFGTGVIISTAFVHLLTHATLMLTNECIGEQEYESTSTAILMAGLFISFLIEYTTHRVAKTFWDRSRYNDELVGVMILEAGIIFHSILIGITVVVAGDSYFVTLFVVIIFHQMFEGIALGSRIAAIGHTVRTAGVAGNNCHGSSIKEVETTPPGRNGSTGDNTSLDTKPPVQKSISLLRKLLMAVAFAVTTPIGMAIGIGVLNTFNGNDPATLWAIGTLDAFSAGILVWVGVVEMWAGDWMFGGEMTNASPLVTGIGIIAMMAGMALMSFLGKWA